MKTVLSKYKLFLKSNNKLNFESYKDLHKWSVNEIEDFWDSIVKFFKIEFDNPPKTIYKFNKNFIKTLWFTDSKISYSKTVFKNEKLNTPAIKYQDENGKYLEISWLGLKKKTLEFQKILVKNNVKFGDRVVGYCSNSPDVVAAFLATNSHLEQFGHLAHLILVTILFSTDLIKFSQNFYFIILSICTMEKYFH